MPSPAAPKPRSQPEAARLCQDWIQEIERAVHGKTETVRRTVLALLARGHLLLEDVPGVGKTTLAQALSRTVDGTYHRIQFTSDLLPGDITGHTIPELNAAGQPVGFRFQPGPLFAHFVVADEVNRASPKAQSALLEAMSERTVSIDGTTHPLPNPFFVLATQNPLEHHGTHPLPESQLDRFMMRLSMGYPNRQHEARVLAEDPAANALPNLRPVLSLQDLLELQAAVDEVKIDESLVSYLLDLVEATRVHEGLALGASTRGALALRRAAQASAVVDGRDYCIPEDIRDLAVLVLSHRITPLGRAGLAPAPEETSWILSEIVDRVAIPL